MRTFAIAAAATAALAGCAKSPDSIAPAYVSDVPYLTWSCDQLGQESARISSALATASKQQEDARTNDTVGVIFLGLPVSTLSGDNVAPEIARLKGEQNAVRQASIKKNCGTAPAAPAITPAATPTAAPAIDSAADGVYNVTPESLKIRSHSANATGDVTAQASAICASHGKSALPAGTRCTVDDCAQREYLFVCK